MTRRTFDRWYWIVCGSGIVCCCLAMAPPDALALLGLCLVAVVVMWALDLIGAAGRRRVARNEHRRAA